MKKLFALVLAAFAALALAACGGEEAPAMYVEPAELTAEEDAVAGLLGLDTEQHIYDVVLDEDVQSMSVRVYELENGEWHERVGGWTQCTEPSGRIALGFDSIPEGIRIAVQQSGGNTGATTYTPEAAESLDGLARGTSLLSQRAELAYGREQPLAIQVFTSGSEMRTFQPESFFEPELYEGYEHVCAVTVAFSDRSVAELTASGD